MLIAALAALVVFLGVVLWTPIDLELAAKRDPELRVRARVAWLYGLVSVDLGSGGREAQPEMAATPGSKAGGGSRGGPSRVWRIARTRGFLPAVVRLVRRIVSGIDLRRAELWARTGLDDPADTGRLLAFLFPLARYLQSVSRVRIDIEPNFVEQVFFFHVRGDLRIVPFRIVGPVLLFAASPATVRAILAARA
ncbi:MAG TPA: DUF2953 domain-containing protein [Vicinamibacteria bacterium]|nr:DUF2953 domain-containing protein [Vicinamibacteria bacterium]